MRVNLRSDTVTRPSDAMRAAMAAAEVGDDVSGEDPTVNALQVRTARLFGYEAALYFPSGTQSNLAAIMSHCQRGDEYLVGQEAHTYRNEGGGAAVLGSVQPQPLANRPDGTMDLAELEAAIKPDDPHYARTRLLALENTIGGKVLEPGWVAEALSMARRHGLATHLDGARIFNAAIRLGRPVKDLCRGFDSVSVCLSKGLGAPVGSVLVGTEDLISRAKRARKMLGGGMRQAGIVAAAGLYALEHNVERLAEDHANAARLGQLLSAIPRLEVEPAQTNMVFVRIAPERCGALAAHLAAHGVDASVRPRTRLCTHLDVDAAGMERAAAAFEGFFSSRAT